MWDNVEHQQRGSGFMLRPRIEPELRPKIQTHADKFYGGNFTMVVNEFCKDGLLKHALKEAKNRGAKK